MNQAFFFQYIFYEGIANIREMILLHEKPNLVLVVVLLNVLIRLLSFTSLDHAWCPHLENSGNALNIPYGTGRKLL